MAGQKSNNDRLKVGAGRPSKAPILDAETELSDVDVSGTELPRDHDGTPGLDGPSLFHKVKDERSILALVASQSSLFAGTQGGEILVFRPFC